MKALTGRRDAFEERDQFGAIALGLTSLRKDLGALVEAYGHPAEDVGVAPVDASDDPFLYALLGAWSVLDRVGDWVAIATAQAGAPPAPESTARPPLRDLLR